MRSVRGIGQPVISRTERPCPVRIRFGRRTVVGFGLMGTSVSCGPDPVTSKTGEPPVTAVDVRPERGIPGSWEVIAGGGGSVAGQFNGPAGIAIGADGSILVAEHGNHRVQRLSATGSPVAEWGRKGSGPGEFVNPYGVAIGADGRVFVADRGNNRLQIFSPTGDLIAMWGKAGKDPGQFLALRRLRSIYRGTCTSVSTGTTGCKSSAQAAIRSRRGVRRMAGAALDQASSTGP